MMATKNPQAAPAPLNFECELAEPPEKSGAR